MDLKQDPAPVPTPAPHDDWTYYRAAVGGEDAYYYLPKFRRFAAEGAFRPDWNWAAFFFGNFWVLHRKQEILFLTYFVAAAALFYAGLLATGSLEVGLACWALLSFGLFPIYANGLYFLHARRLVEKAKRDLESPAERLDFLRNDGLPPGEKRRLRWPEWAVVAGFIGLLASVACGCGGYADYTLRAKCSEAVLACAQVKAQVDEFAMKNGRLPVNINELDQPPPRNKWVKSMDLRRDATIVTTLQGEKAFEGKILVFRPVLEGGNVNWTCGTPDEKFYKYLPATCRNKLEPDRASN